MSSVSAQPSLANLESLLFKATNPTNKIEDVNTIKSFCDAVVDASPEGAGIACRLLAHKIQSPQEREAVQALAVLEACVKACGEDFHVEVGKFKFLNEMIKLVSPRYLGSRTPEHIKRKVIELLYLWTRELPSQAKIAEAYEMLKSQGLVRQDPAYVGGAVFAASLPPRRESPLTEEQTRQLKLLLQSKNIEDLQRANKIIKNIMKEDERKMDALSRRSTELVTANNNAKLLNEMLDHFDSSSSGSEEIELLKELFESCEKMQPKLFRLASDTEDGDEFIGEILEASDDISRAMDRYKLVVKQGKPDVPRRPEAVPRRPPQQDPLEQLLDLGQGASAGGISISANQPAAAESEAAATDSSHLADSTRNHDDDILSLMSGLASTTITGSSEGENATKDHDVQGLVVTNDGASAGASSSSGDPAATPQQQQQQQPQFSVDDLLTNGSPVDSSAAALISSILSSSSSGKPANAFEHRMEEVKESRRRGLEELDLLGETAIKTHLSGTERSPQFEARRNQRMPIAKLQEQKQAQAHQAFAHSLEPLLSEAKPPSPRPGAPVQVRPHPKPGGATPVTDVAKSSKPDDVPLTSQATLQYQAESSHSQQDSIPNHTKEAETKSKDDRAVDPTSSREIPEVKLADLEVPLSSIKPGSVPPLTVTGDGDDSAVSIVLHFGRESPREHVSALVVTVINKTPEPLSSLELHCAVEPRGCRVKLQAPSATRLPAHSPFAPPAAVTQVMLVANPREERPVSLKYVLSYRTADGEPQTEMGQVKELPI